MQIEAQRMKPVQALLLTVVVVLAAASPWAQVGVKERVIDLADGGRIVLRTDGAMGHYDAAGRPVDMKEGQVMIAADGARITMKDDVLWRQIVERAALYYGLASAPPWSRDAAIPRSIQLLDGGRIVVQGDGTMIHYDAAGNRVQMKVGEVMTAKDGTQIMMNDAALWSRIVSADGSK
jgi:hypothetical protein